MTFGSVFPRPFRPPFGPAAGGTRLLIYDTFADADSTSLDAHTIAPINIPATAWTENVGNWQILSNQAALVAEVQSSAATCNSGAADAVLTADVIRSIVSSTAVGRDLGLSLRNRAYHIGINSAAGANKFRIVEASGSVERAAASVTITLGATYAVAATLAGATISGTLNGANSISYAGATTNQTSGVHGLRGTYTSDRIDNFTVTG